MRKLPLSHSSNSRPRLLLSPDSTNDVSPGRRAGRGGPWGDARVYFAASEGPAFGVFRLVRWVKGGGGEWEHGALATFFVESREPTPSLAPRPLPGRP